MRCTRGSRAISSRSGIHSTNRSETIFVHEAGRLCERAGNFASRSGVAHRALQRAHAAARVCLKTRPSRSVMLTKASDNWWRPDRPSHDRSRNATLPGYERLCRCTRLVGASSAAESTRMVDAEFPFEAGAGVFFAGQLQHEGIARARTRSTSAGFMRALLSTRCSRRLPHARQARTDTACTCCGRARNAGQGLP